MRRLTFGDRSNESGEIEGDNIEQIESVLREPELAPARTSATCSTASTPPRPSGGSAGGPTPQADLDVLHDPKLARTNLRGL